MSFKGRTCEECAWFILREADARSGRCRKHTSGSAEVYGGLVHALAVDRACPDFVEA
ncbi:MAG: hypothetical protein ACFFBD_29665 [Candidatus Hodarchaeota archaeon]